MDKSKWIWTSILGVALLAWVLADYYFRERATQVRLEGGAVPVFVLSGSGKLSVFSVYVVSPSDLTIGRMVNSVSYDAFFTQPPVWRIEAHPDPMDGRRVENIRRLTYGVVPSGYMQESPPNGASPTAIVPGREYFFDCDTINAPHDVGGFQISDGKAVPVVPNLPCMEARDGKEVTAPCLKYP